MNEILGFLPFFYLGFWGFQISPVQVFQKFKHDANTRQHQKLGMWHQISIGETNLPRVCGSGYDIWTRWHRIERIGGLSWTLGLGHMWMWESSWGFWSISLSTMKQEPH